MRHKILLALQELPETTDVCLEGVSEVDETFVLDCYKGRPMDAAAGRRPRRHGAKAENRGISSEYLCICTGIQREGKALVATVNRAKPNTKELLDVFEGHLSDGPLSFVMDCGVALPFRGLQTALLRTAMTVKWKEAAFTI